MHAWFELASKLTFRLDKKLPGIYVFDVEPWSRCDSNIRYSITSTDQMDCPNPHGNEPIVVNGTHLLEFQGQQCGYVPLLTETFGDGAGLSHVGWIVPCGLVCMYKYRSYTVSSTHSLVLQYYKKPKGPTADEERLQ